MYGEDRFGEGGEPGLGVDNWLAAQLLPCVAAIEGDAGGSGDRVKYTTFASEPPIYARHA